MVFPSLPLYLDPPNWHQQGNQQIQGHNNNNREQNQHHLVPPQPPPQQPTHHMGIGGSRGGGLLGAQQIRPNSMAEHARQLKIPPPMGPLKCPRCESTNTKFCYYNNYNLTQPRHLCKTCRRYWTQGGALRNVPVGGGCRKNKRPSHKSSAPSGGPPSSSKLSSTSVGVNINSPINIHSGGANSMSFLTSNLQNIGHLGGTSHMGHLSTFTGGPIQTAPFNTNLQDIIMSGRLEKGGVEGDSTHNIGFPQHVVHQFPNFLGGFQIPGSTSAGGLYSGSFQNVRHYGNQGIGDGRDDSNHEQQQQQRQLQHQQQQLQQQQQQQMDDNMAKMNARTNMKSEVKAEVNRQQQGHNLTNEVILSGNTSSADNNVMNTDNNININSNNQFWGGNLMNENVVTSPWTE